MSAPGRRMAKWLVIPLGAAGLAFGAWYGLHMLSAVNGTLGASCDEAARFVRAAELPAGTHERQCTRGQWMSTSYELDFHAPREATDAWLRTSYPDMELTHDCEAADACATPRPSPVPYTDKDGHRLADVVDVELSYEGEGVTRVRISGATM